MEQQLIVIFGATGDLAKRKLLPALLRLFQRGAINEKTAIVCLGRRMLTSAEYFERTGLTTGMSGPDQPFIERFSRLVHYVRFDLAQGSPETLQALLRGVGDSSRLADKRLFYLALPTSAFTAVAHLLKPLLEGPGWQRVVFEKPFGEDLESAQQLNEAIASVLPEPNIYRVDHYLGKELVQNILFLRFANEIFCCSWNRDAIDNIQITVSETLGVENRAEYYDRSGAIRDMLQNHLLQLLSFTAMEPPRSDQADAIRDEAALVIQALRAPRQEDVVVGQYGSGRCVGRECAAYCAEPGVPTGSTTETYVAVRAFVDTPRWRGVPFYLRTGKRLQDRYAEIRIIYKQHRCDGLVRNDRPNMIIIRIQPDEGIALAFNVRKPGSDNESESVLMDFCHHCHFGPNTPEAYEAIMASVMRGDSMLFTRWDWLAASWRYVDRLRAVMPPVTSYAAGSVGPAEADELLAADDRSWVYAAPAAERLSRFPR